ncbi:DUF3606 domain-containing protein [Alsobacter sp. SYSU BS001988]
MADDPTKRGGQDRQRVNIHQRHELDYWSQNWGVTHQQLEAAVKKVGDRAKAVADELGKDHHEPG